jgi:hypothetical protein
MKKGWGKTEIVADPAMAFAGEKCLHRWAAKQDYGSKAFFDLPKGVETIFYRSYVKIPKNLPTTQIRLLGISGVPDGQQTYQTYGAETPAHDATGPFWVDLYLNNWQMNGETRDRYLAVDVKKREMHYILYGKVNKVPADQWFCLEVMLKLNTPGQYDGQIRVWMDGKEVLTPPASILSLRTTAAVQIRTVYDQLYHQSTQMEADCECWMDNRVIARQYVGPLNR